VQPHAATSYGWSVYWQAVLPTLYFFSVQLAFAGQLSTLSTTILFAQSCTGRTLPFLLTTHLISILSATVVSFMHIPVVLRLRVYYAAGLPTNDIIYLDRDERAKLRQGSTPTTLPDLAIYLSLIRTCRKVHREVSHQLFSTNHYFVGSHFTCFQSRCENPSRDELASGKGSKNIKKIERSLLAFGGLSEGMRYNCTSYLTRITSRTSTGFSNPGLRHITYNL
jgi:hypothetical protein